MEVWLMNKDALPTAVETAVIAALTCTGNEDKYPSTDAEELLKSLISKGHESVLEHINFTFKVYDISRALLQELSRHRHISLSVQSTRTALKKIMADEERRKQFVSDAGRTLMLASNALPETVENTDQEVWNSKRMLDMEEMAIITLSAFSTLYTTVKSYVPDYLKYLLPEFIPTTLVMTVNLRELRHIFKLRSQPEALMEFRYLVCELHEAIPAEYHYLFDDVLHKGVFALPEVEDIEDGDADDGKE